MIVPIVNSKHRWNIKHGNFIKERLWSKTTVEIAEEMGVTKYALRAFMRTAGLRKRDFGGLGKQYPILCENPKCGKVFRTKKKDRRYCGRSCAMKHYIAVNGQPKREYKTKSVTN